MKSVDGLAEIATSDLLLDPMRDVASRIIANCPEIRLTALGDDAQLFGSLYSALQLAEARLFELL